MKRIELTQGKVASIDARAITSAKPTVTPLAAEEGVAEVSDKLPKGYELKDRGKDWRDAPYAYKDRFVVVNPKGYAIKEAPTREKAVEWVLRDLEQKPAQPKTPEKMTPAERIDKGITELKHPETGKIENVRKSDIIDVAREELSKNFPAPYHSAKSEALYFDNGEQKIRLAAHDVVYSEDEDAIFIGVGKEIQDADVILTEDMTSFQICQAVKKVPHSLTSEYLGGGERTKQG